MVDDFVCLEDPPTIALLRFGSSDAAQAVMDSLEGSPQIFVGDGTVQVKRAEDLADLEWNDIFPRSVAPTTPTGIKMSSGSDDGNVSEASENGQASSPVKYKREGKGAVGKLINMAIHRKWREPEFIFFYRQENKGQHPKFKCRVRLNGVEYGSSSISPAGANSKWKAKQNAARFCRKVFKLEASINRGSIMPDISSTSRKRPLDSGVPGGNPSKKLKGNTNGGDCWKPTKLVYEKTGKERRGNVRFSCSVTVDDVDYQLSKSRLDWTRDPITNQQLRRLVEEETMEFCQRMRVSAEDFIDAACTRLPSQSQDSKTEMTTNVKEDIISSSSLQSQFALIAKAVTIPDNDLAAATRVVDDLRTLLLKEDSTSEVVLYRNWNLKIRNPGGVPAPLQIYVYKRGSHPQHPGCFTTFAHSRLEEAFNRQDSPFSCPGAPTNYQKEFLNRNPARPTIKVLHKPTGVSFQVVADAHTIGEVQMCRLVEYMCKFDPRCHPLLVLVNYWTNVNGVTFGKPFSSSFHKSVSEPNTLQWLVMLFLYHRGIVPTPREIQGRPHAILKNRDSGIDFGFEADRVFVEEWRARRGGPGQEQDEESEDFVLKVFELFQEFLEFFGELQKKNGNWILNARDGELISTDQFFGRGGYAGQMSNEEEAVLRAVAAGKIYDVPRVFFKLWKVYMIHPFVVSWKVSIRNDAGVVLKRMGESGKRLNGFSDMWRRGGMDASGEQQGSLQSVMKL